MEITFRHRTITSWKLANLGPSSPHNNNTLKINLKHHCHQLLTLLPNSLYIQSQISSHQILSYLHRRNSQVTKFFWVKVTARSGVELTQLDLKQLGRNGVGFRWIHVAPTFNRYCSPFPPSVLLGSLDSSPCLTMAVVVMEVLMGCTGLWFDLTSLLSSTFAHLFL